MLTDVELQWTVATGETVNYYSRTYTRLLHSQQEEEGLRFLINNNDHTLNIDG